MNLLKLKTTKKLLKSLGFKKSKKHPLISNLVWIKKFKQGNDKLEIVIADTSWDVYTIYNPGEKLNSGYNIVTTTQAAPKYWSQLWSVIFFTTGIDITK